MFHGLAKGLKQLAFLHGGKDARDKVLPTQYEKIYRSLKEANDASDSDELDEAMVPRSLFPVSEVMIVFVSIPTHR